MELATRPASLTPALARWTRSLHARQLLRLGDARPDGFASLQWRRAASSERWLRLLVVEPEPSAARDAVEFLLLAQRLLAADAAQCQEQVMAWLSDPAALRAPAGSRLHKCCMGGCHLPGADPDPAPLSAVLPCSRHAASWRRPTTTTNTTSQMSQMNYAVVGGKKNKNKEKVVVTRETPWTLGVVLDFPREFDGEFLALLHRASSDPLGDSGLSEDFKTAYRLMSPQESAVTVRLHLRLSHKIPSTDSLRAVAKAMCKWQLVKRASFAINGIDIAANSLNELLMVLPGLPYHKLLVCASSSIASRMDPLATPTKPVDDAAIRLLLSKAPFHLGELEVCNVRITNFDCVLQPFASGKCQLQALRLREFAMGVVSDGGIFAALRDPCHPIYHSLEELEIDQALSSAGGLSFWLEREAGDMLLKNDRLVKCYIRQACSIYPSTTHRGFWQTRNCEIEVPVPMASKLAFLSSKPIQLPRDVSERILEFAGRSEMRDAQMHYRPIMADQLHHFMRDLDAWKPKRVAQLDSLPYGSYYC